jgi:hypothetical protein
LENRLPVWKVENGCIVSKYGDVTVCFRADMPELFTLTGENYAVLHSAWVKAIKTLPDYSVLHKQDWFVKECYTPQYREDLPSFLDKSFERHFSGREFLNHRCYLYLSKSSPENMRKQSLLTTLARGQLVPKEMLNPDAAAQFLDAVSQFAGIINDSGFVKLTRLTADDIIGTQDKGGHFG